MRLYNSLTGQIEPLPVSANPFQLYACGITPYDTTHLGHAFTYTTVDVLIRYLELCGRRVHYVQNVTDVDDDMLQAAAKAGADWRMLGDQWTRHFIADMVALNVRPPDEMPRATSAIDSIIAWVERLVQSGIAYHEGGSVYFDVEAWPAFGKLSRLPQDQMLPIANARGNHPDDPNKRHPLDFVLWQAQSPDEPAWPSRWGAGRPGWHIECSSIIDRSFDLPIDLHAGGHDLIFPHHECEIAQIEAAGGADPFVRHWMHIAMVRHDGEKMSKSIGNLVMVRDLLEQWHPGAIRLYLAGFHYRRSWSHDPAGLQAATDRLERWRQAAVVPAPIAESRKPTDIEGMFNEAMEDDLNSPKAMQSVDALADRILGDPRRADASSQALLHDLAGVFGVSLEAAVPEAITAGWDDHRRQFVSA